MAKEDMSIEDLKSKLIEYLEVRKENDADEKAKEYVSTLIERIVNPFTSSTFILSD